MTEAAPPVPTRRLPVVLAVVGVVVLAILLGLYAARRTIAREALTAWLQSKGVPATAEVQAIGPNGVTGSIVIGSPSRPDVTVQRAEIGYGFRGLNLEVRSVKLVRPVVRARLQKGQLSVGALDPLIAQFRSRPPRPDARQPRIVIEQGVLLLGTDYGPVRVDAEGLMEDGRLLRLSARSGAARLQSKAFDLDLGSSVLEMRAQGDRMQLSLDAPVSSAKSGQLSAAGARLRLSAVGPYPDLKRRRGDGAVVANLSLSGGRVALGQQAVRNGLLSAAATGQVSGWIDDLAFQGRGVADLRAAGADAAGGRAGALRAALTADDLRWTRKGGDAVQARAAATLSLDSFSQGELQIRKLTAAARGPVKLDAKGLDLDLVAHAIGRGAWTGLGAPTREDSAEIAAVKRAAAGFRFAAPAVAVTGTDGRFAPRLAQPVRLTPDGGGMVTLARAGGGWGLTAAGGGLPKVDAAVSRFAMVEGGARAQGRVKAALSIGPVEQGVFDASGTVALDDGVIRFTADRCAQVAAARLELGENDVEKLAGRLCPAGRPLLQLGGGDWRIAGRAEALSAEAPFLQARVSQGAGAVDLASKGGVLSAALRIASAQVEDAAPEIRFRPVGLTGEAQLARDVWTASLAVRDPAGRGLATALLRHEGPTGRGGVDIDTGVLRFAEGGLQPAELSPLAAAIGSPAVGEARFTGRLAWTPEASTSNGVLEVPGLSFESPAGRVTGLAGRVVFTSLAPLVAAPGQALQAQSIASPVGPLTDVRVAFGLEAELLRVSGGEAQVGGGVVRIETLEVPLAAGKPIRGVLILEGVQLHDLVEASPFGDRVEFDAKVAGRIPFIAQGQRVRVQNGALHAIQPGRLSIQRSALAGVAATGAVETQGAPAAVVPEPSTDTFSDFAYQAMENLAFSTLSAEVNSRDDGRLAVLFKIIGEHDPPQHQEIRLGLMDLIQRKFLGRKLPLPSGTGVNLTLDTTLNLDDLLSDYAEFRRLHGSAQVQP